MSEIYLDLETLRWSDEVDGGWSNVARFGMAVAVTWSEREGHIVWPQKLASELIAYLAGGERVVTFNGERFDFVVLSAYGDVEPLYPRSFDLLAAIERTHQRRVSLDQLAMATLGRGKTADGKQAVLWWRTGQPAYRQRVIEYCRNDVDLLRGLVNVGRKQGYLFCSDREALRVRIAYPAENKKRKTKRGKEA